MTPSVASELCGQDTTLCAATVELYFKLYGRKNPILTMSAAVTSAEVCDHDVNRTPYLIFIGIHICIMCIPMVITSF